MTVVRLTQMGRWPSPPMTLALGALGLAGGLLLAGLPLIWASILLLVVLVFSLTWINPLVGLGAALFFGPFKPLTEFFVPSFPLDLGQWFLFVALAAWVARRVAHREPLIARSPLSVPLGIFLLVAALSLGDAISLTSGLRELLKWVELALTAWLVIHIAGQRRWGVLVALLLLIAIFQAGVGVWQFLRNRGPEHFLILDDRFYRAYGTFEQPNPFGGFIGISFPLAVGLTIATVGSWLARAHEIRQAALQRGRRGLAERVMSLFNWRLVSIGLAGLLAALLATALVMSWSRGAWLGAGIAGLMMLLRLPRRWWVGLLLVILMVSGFVYILQGGYLPDAAVERLLSLADYFQSFDVRGADINDESFAVIERLAHWQSAMLMARQNPLLGVGFGNYAEAYPQFAFPNWPLALGHAHNYYLNVLAEVGLLGLAAYLILWGSVFCHTIGLAGSDNVWIRGIAIGLLGTWTHLSVHNLVDNLWVSNVFLHVGALLGVLSILVIAERESLNERSS